MKGHHGLKMLAERFKFTGVVHRRHVIDEELQQRAGHGFFAASVGVNRLGLEHLEIGAQVVEHGFLVAALTLFRRQPLAQGQHVVVKAPQLGRGDLVQPLGQVLGLTVHQRRNQRAIGLEVGDRLWSRQALRLGRMAAEAAARPASATAAKTAARPASALTAALRLIRLLRHLGYSPV